MKFYLGTFILLSSVCLTGGEIGNQRPLLNMNLLALYKFNNARKPFEDFIAHLQTNNVEAVQQILLYKANFATQHINKSNLATKHIKLWNDDNDVVYPIHLAQSSLCA